MLLSAAGCQTQTLRPAPRTVALQSQTGAIVGTIHLEPGKPPALWPLRTIEGVEVTRAFPFRDDVPGESHDHPHHRSMWSAHGDVNGVDFWHEGGRVEHDSIRNYQDGAVEVAGRWIDGDGQSMLTSRTLWRAVDDGGTRTVVLRVVLEPVGGPVVFGDTKEGTLAIRLASQLRLTGDVAGGTLANSEGMSGAGVWGRGATWIEVTGRIEDTPVKLRLTHASFVEQVLGADSVPEEDALVVRWHARPYGLIAANPFGERAFVGSGEAKETIVERGQQLVLTLVVTVE